MENWSPFCVCEFLKKLLHIKISVCQVKSPYFQLLKLTEQDTSVIIFDKVICKKS